MTSHKEWADEHVKGIESQLMPSFEPDMEALDEEGIRHDVRQTIDHGFNSVLVTCEAGLTFEESKDFYEIVADEAGDDLHVNTTLVFDTWEQSFEMVEHVEAVGSEGDGALMGYPLQWLPDDAEQVAEKTEEIAETADIPLILYVNEKFAFDGLHPAGFPIDQIDRMADIPNAVAIKISDPALMGPIDRMAGDRLLLSNPIEDFVPSFYDAYDQQWIGAGPYEIYQTPEQPIFADYFDLLLDGQYDAAMEKYWRLTPIRKVFFQHMQPQLQLGTYHWPEHKYYQWLSGGNGGYTRQPAMELAEHRKREIREARKAIGLQNTDSPEKCFYEGRANFEEAEAATADDD